MVHIKRTDEYAKAMPDEEMLVNPTVEKIIGIIGTSNEKVILVVKSGLSPLEKPGSVRDYVVVWYEPNGYSTKEYVCKSGWYNGEAIRCDMGELHDLFDSIIDYGYEIVWFVDKKKALRFLNRDGVR